MVTPLFDSSLNHWVHPCLRCGACCALYRVSFYWAETDDVSPGGVPAELTVPISPHLSAMGGTDIKPARCVGLEGELGERVRCRIHPQRPSPCREFIPSFEDGQHHPRCDQARAAHGLLPLTPEDWHGQPDDNSPAPQPPRLPRVA
jgi:uncharacterized protein